MLQDLSAGDRVRLRLADLGVLERGLRGWSGVCDVCVVSCVHGHLEVMPLNVMKGRPPIWRVPLNADAEAQPL